MSWQCGSFEFSSETPTLMGVLNMTPDSFSDGGKFLDETAAYDQAVRMHDAGAAIIDVGGESTRPGGAPIDETEEWTRIGAIVRRLSDEGLCVSVDTRHADVAARALDAGASIINDVTGFSDAAMRAAVKAGDCGLVVMHSRIVPVRSEPDETAVYDDVVREVRDYLRDRAIELEAEGVARERICLDPGPGFSKTASQTIELMRNLHEIARLGYPLLAASSRKRYVASAYKLEHSFEGEALEALDRASGTEALLACELGASVVRTHNVEATLAALRDLRPLVVLGLGSNLAMMGAAAGADAEAAAEASRESKIAQINLAIAQLCTLPDTQIVDIASFYESEPAYDENQDVFVNTIVLARTGLPPRELLEYLHTIENALGRVRTRPNGPRTIDLDIEDYQLYLSDAPELTLPHPRVNERDFVVKPLLELRPNYRLADGTRVGIIPEAERLGRAHRL